MNVVDIQGFTVHGISVRTINANEMNVATAKIAPLWGEYFVRVASHVKEGGMTYGVYSHYESDFNGEFTVLAGADAVNEPLKFDLEEVKIEAGKYLVFSSKGAMPQAVINAWTNVWHYFSPANSTQCEYVRAYTTDFERYCGVDEVEVYIAIQ